MGAALTETTGLNDYGLRNDSGSLAIRRRLSGNSGSSSVADEVAARSAARNTPARATVETGLASPDQVEIVW
jgi:hypothetical protein